MKRCRCTRCVYSRYGECDIRYMHVEMSFFRQARERSMRVRVAAMATKWRQQLATNALRNLLATAPCKPSTQRAQLRAKA